MKRLKFWRPHWLSNLAICGFALAFTILFLYLSSGGLIRWYGRSPYHRLQAKALLQGQFSLADTIYQIATDLAWYKGQIQQVWGLGVGLWLAPFEGIWHLLGKDSFPDRLALALLVFIYAAYAILTAFKFGRVFKKPGLGFLLSLLLLFFPPFWFIALAPQLIYEETVFYACLASQILLVAMVRFVVFGQEWDFLICCCLGGWLALLRPTHAIYGITAVALASICLNYPKPASRSHRSKRKPSMIPKLCLAIIGWACFGGGILFLLWSNTVRFGSPTEFGHGLTVTPEANLFFSRFYPSKDWENTWPLVKELFGWLFLPTIHLGEPWFKDNLVPLQAAVPRWRDVYLPAFNLSYLAVMVLGVCWGSIVLLRRLRPAGFLRFSRQPLSRAVFALLVWTLLCFAFLCHFYIRLASMSSRYVMDFGPAILAGVILAVCGVYRRWPRVTFLLVLIAIGLDLDRIRLIPMINQPTTTPLIRGLAASLGNTIEEYEGAYSIESHPSETDLLWNGFGWQPNGLAGPIVIVAVDGPQFVEITVDPRFSAKGGADTYRARIAEYELPIVSTRTVDKSQVVRFEVPEAIRQRGGDEFVYLCFVKSFDADDRESRRKLQSVRWR